jgi:hypothetical protein
MFQIYTGCFENTLNQEKFNTTALNDLRELRKTSVSTVAVPTANRTKELPNNSLERCTQTALFDERHVSFITL